jgi:hypothetical protein
MTYGEARLELMGQARVKQGSSNEAEHHVCASSMLVTAGCVERLRKHWFIGIRKADPKEP